MIYKTFYARNLFRNVVSECVIHWSHFLPNVSGEQFHIIIQLNQTRIPP